VQVSKFRQKGTEDLFEKTIIPAQTGTQAGSGYELRKRPFRQLRKNCLFYRNRNFWYSKAVHFYLSK
jgi:hypothetical protein